MAGWNSNGLPAVGPVTVNGVAAIPPNGQVTNLTTTTLFEGDTALASGRPPQSVAVSAFQIAALSMDLLLNQATSTVHAATLNTRGGFITTEALTTAAGSTYTFTLTNSQVTATTPPPIVCMRDGSNTGGNVQITSVTVTTSTVTIVITNIGTTAFNGTFGIAFHL